MDEEKPDSVALWSGGFKGIHDLQDVVMLGGDMLLCPKCRSDKLHHQIVEVNNRRHEDGDGICARVYDLQVSTREVLADSDTFVGRRDDLKVFFWCEDCNTRPILVIYQYKGSTFMGWVWK